MIDLLRNLEQVHDFVETSDIDVSKVILQIPFTGVIGFPITYLKA